MQIAAKQHVNCCRGFTLVELILVVGTIGMVTGALVGVVGNSYKDFQAGSDVSALFQDGQAAIEQITRILRQAKSIDAVSPESWRRNTFITFTNADGITEQFKINDATSDLEYEYGQPASLSTLIGNVTELWVTGYDISGNPTRDAGKVRSFNIAIHVKDAPHAFVGRVYLPSAIDSSPILWYKFDGDPNDSSGNNNHGKPKNFPPTGPKYVKDVAGTDSNALSFDGVNDYVEFAGLTNPVNMTYTLWIKAVSYGGSYNTLIEFANDNPYFGIRNTGLITLYGCVTTKNKIKTGKWYHIAVTSDGTKSFIYINGKLSYL